MIIYRPNFTEEVTGKKKQPLHFIPGVYIIGIKLSDDTDRILLRVAEKKREIINVLTKNDFLMNIETAKQINLADYLHSLGYSPVKQQGINLWYKSP